MKKILAGFLVALVVMTIAGPVFAGATYDKVAKSGVVRVGMMYNSIPAAYFNDKNEWVGFDVDIAEEVVGEIQTRDQSEEELVVELGRGKFLLSGKMDIEYFMRSFNIHIDKKGFETLAGFIEYRLGRIPKKGDRLDHERYTFIIDEATDRSIEKVIVQTLKKKKKLSGQP